ncbi:MAG TPA: DUF6573 family protein [Myxococcota bacterium]|nr:DUF6573 family protein [Myxococcota bacterium]
MAIDDDFFGPLVVTYTRAQMLDDKGLVDPSEWASARTGFHRGFTVPVAVTRAVWDAIEAIPGHLEGIADVRRHAHDVLWMANLAARDDAQGGEKWTSLSSFRARVRADRGSRCVSGSEPVA